MNKCKDCGREYQYKKGKNCTKYRCNTCYISGNRRKRKKIAVELFGGKCQKCGYQQSLRALCFHHVDPLEKDKQISSYITASWKRMVKELGKCVLLCHNCHDEYHDGMWTITEIKRIRLGKEALEINIPTGRNDRTFLPVVQKTCPVCEEQFETKNENMKYCSYPCSHFATRRVVRPSKLQLGQEIKNRSWMSLGRKYGVSDNAVRKWARHYGLMPSKES